MIGERIKKMVKGRTTGTGYIYLPKSWVGRKVLIQELDENGDLSDSDKTVGVPEKIGEKNFSPKNEGVNPMYDLSDEEQDFRTKYEANQKFMNESSLEQFRSLGVSQFGAERVKQILDGVE